MCIKVSPLNQYSCKVGGYVSIETVQLYGRRLRVHWNSTLIHLTHSCWDLYHCNNKCIRALGIPDDSKLSNKTWWLIISNALEPLNEAGIHSWFSESWTRVEIATDDGLHHANTDSSCITQRQRHSYNSVWEFEIYRRARKKYGLKIKICHEICCISNNWSHIELLQEL